MSYFLICCAKTIAIIVQSEKFLNLQPKHLAWTKRTKSFENSKFLVLGKLDLKLNLHIKSGNALVKNNCNYLNS